MRPNRDSLLISTARLWAQRSTCSRAHVGVVISRDGRILVQGYNGAPASLPHCDHTCICLGPKPKLPNEVYVHLASCPSITPCTISVHAEANAIAFAAKYGVTLDKASVHATHAPCPNCCMLLINAGIQEVNYSEDHRDMSGISMLYAAGIQVMQFNGMIPA